MTPERIAQIKNTAKDEAEYADGILEGEMDNYDGADGARAVAQLCRIIDELVAEIEAKP